MLGDFNAKVGNEREPGIIDPFGLGDRNNKEERLVDFCREQNLFAANTRFEQKKYHTWTAPNGNAENQIDFILVSRRFRSSVQCAKVRFNADCGSDHNPVMAKILTKLKCIRKKKKEKTLNRDTLNDVVMKEKFKTEIADKSQENNANTWDKMKSCIGEVAKRICREKPQIRNNHG